MALQLPRVSAFPILPEGHLLYKVSDVLSNPAKVRDSHPLIGKQAPEIILQDQLGRDCSLLATIELGRPIVLFFFPLAGSPHCTLESCYFRDALVESAVFADLDAIVIGVSQDNPETLRKFVKRYKLSYVVLSDTKKTAMESFQVSRTWLGLVNQRSTFVIDPAGVVRGMCEGVMSASSHKQFAEKWLIRIEHEMADRAREVGEASTPRASPQLPMAPLESSSTKYKYGAENSAPGGGIDRAPRFGAAPLNPPTLVSLNEKKAKDAQISGGQSFPMNRATTSDDSHKLRGPHGGTGVNRSASTKAPRRSFKNVFSKKTPPPIPPTYRNFDSTWQTYGTVEVEPPRSASQSLRGSGSDSHLGSWDLRANGPSLSEPSMGSRTRPTTASSYGSILSNGVGSGAKSGPLSSQGVPTYTVSHNLAPPTAEASELMGGRPGTPPRRSRDAPSDVPEDADEDEAADDFVTQLAGGAMDLTPRKASEKPLTASDSVKANGLMGLGALPPGGALASAKRDLQQVPQPPSRTTSRNLPRSAPRPTSARRPSLETVRSANSPTSARDGYTSPHETSGPKALAPRPRHSRPNASTSMNRVRSAEVKDAGVPVEGDQTPPARDSLDELNGVQVHSARRFTIQKEPVSPKRMSRGSSGPGSVRQSPALNGSAFASTGNGSEVRKPRSRETSGNLTDGTKAASSRRHSGGSGSASILRKPSTTTSPAPDRVTKSSSHHGHDLGPSPRTDTGGATFVTRRPSSGSSNFAASRAQRRSSALGRSGSLTSSIGESQSAEDRRPSAASIASTRSAASAGTFGR